jgi:uncharacterized protein YbjT (DUF2867 family)
MRPSVFCVLGGTGFVGSHLVSRLVSEGHQVRILTRNPERHRALKVLPAVELKTLDVHNPEALETALRGADVAINLIGILNERGRDGSGFERAHATLTRTLIAACRAVGIRRVLQMSSLGADESAPSHYLRSKGRAEGALREAAGSLDVTILKPSVIFGPGDSFLNRFASLLAVAPVMPIARAGARLSPVYVGDVVDACLRSLHDRHTIGETYELCGPRVYTLGEIVAYVAALRGLRRAVIGLPDALGWLQAAALEWLPGKPLSLDNFRSLSVDSVCQVNGLARLGLPATPLETMAPSYLGPAGLTAVRARHR